VCRSHPVATESNKAGSDERTGEFFQTSAPLVERNQESLEVNTVATELRKTGISVVGDLPWGAHFCCFYETKQDLLDILIPYFKTGLENNEFCLWVISNSELLIVAEATSALRSALPDLDRYVAERSIEFVGHDEWFLSGKTFDPHKVANRFQQKLNEALARGYAGIRVNGSPAWLRDAGPNELRQFEAELDKLFPTERTIASCTYPIATIGADQIFEVVRTHQFAIARRHGEWEVFETPELIQAKAEIRRLNDELEQRVIERTNELRVANEDLRREITERNRAEERLRASSERLRALTASIESAREEEGKRIAREIHDELGSMLTTLKWDLAEIEKTLSAPANPSQITVMREKLSALMKLADAAINALRRIASELRPSMLDDLGLVAAIEWQAQQFQARTGIVCDCDCSLEKDELSDEQSTGIFRILQEALTNVLRHAQATKVEIKVNKQNGYFVLSVSDNGKGIMESEKSEVEALGMLGMRERAHLMAGELEVRGVEGKGTVVTVRVPISGQDGVLKMTR
jgi:signal transduction histidine kinase